jgi:hypothetical protein
MGFTRMGGAFGGGGGVGEIVGVGGGGENSDISEEEGASKMDDDAIVVEMTLSTTEMEAEVVVGKTKLLKETDSKEDKDVNEGGNENGEIVVSAN